MKAFTKEEMKVITARATLQRKITVENLKRGTKW